MAGGQCEAKRLKALRIYLITPAFPPEVGGQEMHLFELCENLVAQGASVKVITRRRERAFAAVERMGPIPVVRLAPVGETRGGGWRALLPQVLLLANVAWRLLRDVRQYDVVLVSGFNMFPLPAVLASALTRKPCVVRPESPLELGNAITDTSLRKMNLAVNSLPVRLFAAIRGAVARRVSRYIAISTEIEQRLLDNGIDRAKIDCVANGIDTGRFAPVDQARKLDLRDSLSLPRHQRLLIYTGRLVLSKGVMMLAEIWSQIAAHYPDAHLILVGTGAGSGDDCEPALRALIAERNLQARVTLTGNVTNVHEYLKAADIFVFPSDSEGFGLSILEAMAVGLPLVSTRVGVAADVGVEAQAGLFVPPKDSVSFTQALRRMLDDEALQRRCGAQALRAVASSYSMSTVARRHIEVFTVSHARA